MELGTALDTILGNPALGPHVDETRIGAAGFSLGGYSVIALAGVRVDMTGLLERCADDPQGGSCQLPPSFRTSSLEPTRCVKADPSYANALASGNASGADPRIRAVYAIAPAVGEASIEF